MTENLIKQAIINNIIDFFGKEKVDTSTQQVDTGVTKVMIHFPFVTVTNEFNESIDITDLFVAIHIDNLGRICESNGDRDSAYHSPNHLIKMVRTSYTRSQLLSRYSHSHLPVEVATWNHPCLGRGPLNATIRALAVNQEELIENWTLFCFELNEYVQVESIAGTPYIRLQSVGAKKAEEAHVSNMKYYSMYMNRYVEGCYNRVEGDNAVLDRTKLIEILLCSHKLKFNFIDGQYGIATSELDFILLIGEMIEQFLACKGVSKEQFYNHTSTITNKYLKLGFSSNMIRYVIKNDSLAIIDHGEDITSIIDRYRDTILTFKGIEYKLTVTNFTLEKDNQLILPDRRTCGMIYKQIVKLINLIYGNKTKLTKQSQFLYINC